MANLKIIIPSLIVMILSWPASFADTTPPLLSAGQMNCADTKKTDDSRLTEQEGVAVAKSLKQFWEEKARSQSWKHGPHLEGYTLAFCGMTRNGRHYVIVDGIYKFLGAMVCDDAAGFGVVYDPRDKKFGDIVFGVSSCAPGHSE